MALPGLSAGLLPIWLQGFRQITWYFLGEWGRLNLACQIAGQITWASQNVWTDYLDGQTTWASANCWADYLGITAFVTVRRDTLLRHGLVVLLRETALAVRGCGVQHLEPGALTVLPVFNCLIMAPSMVPPKHSQ